MSFDWRSFATGFLERQQEISTERRDEAKTFEKEQRAAVDRNAQTISRRRAIADQVTGYATYLQNNGVSDEQLQAVIASGPQAIATLTERVQAAVDQNRGRPLGSSDVATIINMPEGFTPVNVSMDEFIRQTYGLSAPTVSRSQPEEELTFLQRISGRGEMARAEERLGRTPVAEGMTILDINRAAQAAEYQSLIPGTFVTFATDRRYDVTDQGVDFLRDFSNQLDIVTGNRDYKALSTSLPGGISIEEAEQMQLQMRIETVDPLIRGYARIDPEGFMRAHQAQIRLRLGDEYVQQLREELGLDVPEGVADATTDATTEDTADDVTDTAIPTATPEATTQVSEEAAPEVELPEAPRAEDTDVDSPETVDAEPLVEPPTDTRVRNPETGEPVTYQQWLAMSRSAREAAGLPVSFLGGQRYFRRFGVGMGTADPETGQRITEQTTESMQTTQPEAYRALSDQGVDDISIALLSTRGTDMIQYLQEQGATDQEAVFNALTEWGQQNDVVMPFDKSALVFALMSVLNR
jgi:hypothetical protein